MADIVEYSAALHYLGRGLQMAPDAAFLTGTRNLVEELALRGLLDANLIPPPSDEELASFCAAAASDHLRLFSGPNPLAPLWESVWLERDKLLFGKATGEVAELYYEWGMAIAEAGREPEDHLGLEISFLAWLLENLSQNPGAVSFAGATSRDTASALLNAHIMKFAPQALQQGAENANSEYYRALCQCGIKILQNLGEELLADK